MKKVLFFFVCCIAAITAKAQLSNIKITNNTNCTVYFMLFGDVTPGCGAGYASGLLSLPSTGVASWTPGTVPGGMNCVGTSCTPPSLSGSDNFSRALISSGSQQAGCFQPRYRVGEVCSGWASSATYDALDNSCTVLCAGITATWTNMGTYIDLVFQ